MVKKWKQNMEDEIGDIYKSPPDKFIDSFPMLCIRNNPQSYSYKKNLKKIEELKCYNYCLDKIFVDMPDKIFTTTKLMDMIDQYGISNGARQRNILHYMTCKGILRTKFKQEDDKNYYLFEKLNGTEIAKCPHLIENEKKTYCDFDFRNEGIRKKKITNSNVF